MNDPKDLQRAGQVDLTRLLPRNLTDAEVRALDSQSYNVRRAGYAIQRILEARKDVAEAQLAAERMEAKLRDVAEARREANSGGKPHPKRGGAPQAGQIQALALRAVLRFARLDQVTAERAWTAWKAELPRRLPPYVAAEVIRAAEKLRQLGG